MAYAFDTHSTLDEEAFSFISDEEIFRLVGGAKRETWSNNSPDSRNFIGQISIVNSPFHRLVVEERELQARMQDAAPLPFPVADVQTLNREGFYRAGDMNRGSAVLGAILAVCVMGLLNAVIHTRSIGQEPNAGIEMAVTASSSSFSYSDWVEFASHSVPTSMQEVALLSK